MAHFEYPYLIVLHPLSTGTPNSTTFPIVSDGK